MTTKTRIVERLGEEAVLLPDLIGAALAANDRAKLRMSLLQEAVAHAEHPERPLPNLDAELHAAQLPATDFAAVAGARKLAAGSFSIPGAGALWRALHADAALMLKPVTVAGGPAASTLAARLAALEKAAPPPAGDLVSAAGVLALTSARRGDHAPDSEHLLIMDLHREVNRIAAESAVEDVDGARVQRALPQDRPRIQALMRGIARTRPLAFGHPGLGTTATRAGGRLIIQNDLGTTDAHVLVVHVEQCTVTITYTDVHRSRARFFASLFAGQGVAWSPLDEQPPEGALSGESFYLLTGRLTAADEGVLDGFLDFLGSRLVFLIDWNRARKALQSFVGKRDAVELLSWSAAEDHGHRAFLELGGEQLVFDAVRRVAAERVPYGTRLDAALGPAQTIDFLRRVLAIASRGLAAGRSLRLLRDEIQADLARRFESAQSALLALLIRHLGLTRMLAGTIRDALGSPHLSSLAARHGLALSAKRLEEKADRLTLEAREIGERQSEWRRAYRPVIDEIENATDSLDECAFLLSLFPDDEAADPIAHPLLTLADIVERSVSDLVRAVCAALHLPEGLQVDATDALQAIDAVLIAERRADIVERDAISAFMQARLGDARVLLAGLEVARALETTTDHLAHAALGLRSRLIDEMAA